MDSHAQLEIRRYAEEIWRIVQAWVPAAAQAFEEYELYATKLSAIETELMRAMVPAQLPPLLAARLNELKPRQRAAFLAKLGL
jgi:thymidylate synthase (FAD)